MLVVEKPCPPERILELIYTRLDRKTSAAKTEAQHLDALVGS
jgi:hypothetical protein